MSFVVNFLLSMLPVSDHRSTVVVFLPMGITLRRLLSSDDPLFAQVFRIYASSINLREQKSLQQLAKDFSRKTYRWYVARTGPKLVGFSIVCVLGRGQAALLEYMAVHSAMRGKGFGSLMFRRTAKAVRREFPDIPLLLEVDSPQEPGVDWTLRQRRMAFYRRLGCRVVDGCDYILPLPGKGRPPKMNLLAHFSGRAPVVSRRQLRRWLAAIYREVYACPATDPRIERMLKPIADPVEMR